MQKIGAKEIGAYRQYGNEQRQEQHENEWCALGFFFGFWLFILRGFLWFFKRWRSLFRLFKRWRSLFRFFKRWRSLLRLFKRWRSLL